jgi:CRP/FNR family transcriptional regulator
MNNSERKDIHNSDIPLICQACEARHKGVCGALSPSQLTELSKSTTKTAHEHSNELQSSDQDQEYYSNILSGVVKLTKLLPDGRQQIVGLQFAPDFLGRPFSKQSSVIAEAATNVRLCSFPKNVIEKFIDETPDMERRLHEQHLNELDEARDWMLTLGRKTALEKLASFLVLIVSHIDPESTKQNGVSMELPLKRGDIADYLGLTIETISRQLTNLRKKGVIEIGAKRAIRIVDVTKLNAIAESAD